MDGVGPQPDDAQQRLVAATGGAAAGIAHPEVGVVAPGRFADFVLVIKGGAIGDDRRADVTAR